MIVISSDVVLSVDEESAGVNTYNPRIGYRNIITESNVVADEEASGYQAVNLALPPTYLRWRGASTDPQAIVVTQAAANVNYFAIAGHNLADCTIQLQSSDDGASWDDVTAEILPGTNNVLYVEFADTSAAYWQLLLTPGANVPEIAVLHIGRSLRMQRRLYVGHAPLTLNRNSEVSSGYSESGQFLGRVVRRTTYAGSAAFQNLTPTWYRDYMEPFVAHAVTGPFFFAWRPGDYPDEVAYCWLSSDVRANNQRSNGMMQCSIEMQGLR